MKILDPNHIKRLAYLSIVLFASMSIFTAINGCIASPKNDNGIVKLASRGYPVAQSIAWSPTDDNKILVMADAGMGGPGHIEVYIFDLLTGHNEKVINTEGVIFNMGWEPSGKSVLIDVGENTEGFEPKGWWLVNLEEKSAKYLSDYWKVSYAPDGKTLAVFTGMENNKLQLINGETDSIETIYSLPGSGYVSNPAWSPDGKYIAFSYGDSEPGDLFVFNLETREVVKITDGNLNDNLAWSPKGNIIALERRAHDEYKVTLHLKSADGKCDIEIPNLERVFSPTWSPDGKKLGYFSLDGIYSLDVNQVMGRDIYQDLCP
jgi:Tol biopolymer transport system component